MADLATPIVLLADIGGTNSRFALAGSDGRPTRMLIIENDSVANLEGAIARYLDESGARPSAAVLAVAGPLESEEVALTNRAWRFRPGELAQRFGFAKLRLVNDFEAIAWALYCSTSWATGRDLHLLVTTCSSEYLQCLDLRTRARRGATRLTCCAALCSRYCREPRTSAGICCGRRPTDCSVGPCTSSWRRWSRMPRLNG